VDEPAGDLLVLALTDDLFLVPRLEDTVRALGGRARIVGQPEDLGVQGAAAARHVPLTEPLEGAEAEFVLRIVEDRPSLILFDLAARTIPWEGWIQVLKTSAATRRIPIVAFGPHVEHESLEHARAAGADLVLSRGELHATLPEVLRDWARPVDPAALARGCEEPLSPEAHLGIAQLNRKEFFEAHETLERAWIAETGPGRELLRSLIQVAVAFLQVERGNRRGARKMLLRMRQWLDPLPSPCRGVDVAGLRSQMEALRRAVDGWGGEDAAEVIRSAFRPVRWAGEGEAPSPS
jgi:predicted metal-dependent hydrolase